jgi:hypothetical protein
MARSPRSTGVSRPMVRQHQFVHFLCSVMGNIGSHVNITFLFVGKYVAGDDFGWEGAIFWGTRPIGNV